MHTQSKQPPCSPPSPPPSCAILTLHQYHHYPLLLSPLACAPPPTPTLHMDEGETKQKRMTKPMARDFLLVGKDIQNKTDRPIGLAGTEDCHLHEFFGTGLFVIAKLWILLADHNFIPPEGEIKHLLWTLHFLKAYPRQAAVCSMVGGSTGAIDPKTFQKYMWPLICAMANLEPAVVSIK